MGVNYRNAQNWVKKGRNEKGYQKLEGIYSFICSANMY